MPTAIERVEDAEARLFADLGLDVDRGTVGLDDGGTELRVIAAGDGHPVVLLTSEGQVASSWAPLLAELPGVRGIACELPGFGGSTRADYRGVDLRALARRLVTRVLDVHGLDRAVLVGSSAGGALALWAAAALPERVEGLALLGCPAPAAPGSHLPATLVPVGVRGIDRLLLDLPLPPFGVQRRVFAAVYGSDAIDDAPVPLLEAMHHAMDRPFFAPGMASFAETAYRVRRAEPALHATDDELARITVPTVIVWGERDRFGGARVARRFASRLPRARLELLDAGHAPWFEHPAACARALTDLLESLPDAAPVAADARRADPQAAASGDAATPDGPPVVAVDALAPGEATDDDPDDGEDDDGR